MDEREGDSQFPATRDHPWSLIIFLLRSHSYLGCTLGLVGGSFPTRYAGRWATSTFYFYFYFFNPPFFLAFAPWSNASSFAVSFFFAGGAFAGLAAGGGATCSW